MGLCRNLKNLISIENIDVNKFFPKCYDLNDSNLFEDFVEEYKFCRVFYLFSVIK